MTMELNDGMPALCQMYSGKKSRVFLKGSNLNKGLPLFNNKLNNGYICNRTTDYKLQQAFEAC